MHGIVYVPEHEAPSDPLEVEGKLYPITSHHGNFSWIGSSTCPDDSSPLCIDDAFTDLENNIPENHWRS